MKNVVLEQRTKDIIFGHCCDLVTSMKVAMKEILDKCDEGCKEFSIVLDAYNKWQEAEHAFANYVYDLDNADDFTSLVKGGMTIDDATKLGCKFKELGMHKRFVMKNYDYADSVVYQPCTFKGVKEMLKADDEFIMCVLCFVGRVEEYCDLYELLVTNHVLENM